MMKPGAISRRLQDHLSERAHDIKIKEVRIGLGYAGVHLENGRLGLAAVLRHELEAGCTTLERAGTLTSLGASGLLELLVEGTHPLDRTVGLAAANALISPEAPEDEEDTLGLMDLTARDRVAMVGLFAPLVGKIRNSGADLSIIERDPTRSEVVDERSKEKILRECTVAIITATTLITHSLEEILNSLGSPRHVALLGPSTPLLKEAFEGTPVTHLGGSAPLDTNKILQIISEGGGTPAMRPFLRFITIVLKG